jgi:hypothetical protein
MKAGLRDFAGKVRTKPLFFDAEGLAASDDRAIEGWGCLRAAELPAVSGGQARRLGLAWLGLAGLGDTQEKGSLGRRAADPKARGRKTLNQVTMRRCSRASSA